MMMIKIQYHSDICWKRRTNCFQFSNIILTCSPLHDDDELDAIGLVQGPPPLLVEVGVTEVPTMCVQQSKVVPEKPLV